MIHPEENPIFCTQCFSEEFTMQNPGVVTIPKRPQFTPHPLLQVSRGLRAETRSLFFEESQMNLEIDQLEKWRKVFSTAVTDRAEDLTIWLHKDLHASKARLRIVQERLGFEMKCNWGMETCPPTSCPNGRPRA